MHDLKNITIAWISTITSVLAAVESKTLVSIISAIVLPIIFFTIGKTIDAALQIHFQRSRDAARARKRSGGRR